MAYAYVNLHTTYVSHVIDSIHIDMKVNSLIFDYSFTVCPL